MGRDIKYSNALYVLEMAISRSKQSCRNVGTLMPKTFAEPHITSSREDLFFKPGFSVSAYKQSWCIFAEISISRVTEIAVTFMCLFFNWSAAGETASV